MYVCSHLMRNRTQPAELVPTRNLSLRRLFSLTSRRYKRIFNNLKQDTIRPVERRLKTHTYVAFSNFAPSANTSAVRFSIII